MRRIELLLLFEFHNFFRLDQQLFFVLCLKFMHDALLYVFWHKISLKKLHTIWVQKVRLLLPALKLFSITIFNGEWKQLNNCTTKEIRCCGINWSKYATGPIDICLSVEDLNIKNNGENISSVLKKRKVAWEFIIWNFIKNEWTVDLAMN